MRELWLSRNTVIEIAILRGYTTSQQPLAYPEFTARYPGAANNPSLLNFVAAKGDQSLAVHFTTEDKLPKATLEKIIGDYISQNVQALILITPGKLNPACKAFLKTVKLCVEHFLVEELMFNVTKHQLVPAHRILGEEETAAVLKNLKIDRSNMPAILTTDIVCRYIGGKAGDILEITRDSLTAGKSIYYRAVKEI